MGYPRTGTVNLTSMSAVKDLDEADLVQLVQWSDIIVLDYLTGHNDRLIALQVGKVAIFAFLFPDVQ